jgi:hypothetical protein
MSLLRVTILYKKTRAIKWGHEKKTSSTVDETNKVRKEKVLFLMASVCTFHQEL